MSSSSAKLGARYQVVIPKDIRQALHLQPGDYLEVTVRDGQVVMTPRSSAAKRLFGKHREVWAGVDAVNYVRQERSAWRD
ncbi:MAG: AbrB/MazE/SpoVT family DNA-binding domain-containing protein [Chloroflexaceae bacterium]|nr:AbrB/MazE/SpoVT family DNA-binding domain-containing protein [Chloroflexaceae bacterium]